MTVASRIRAAEKGLEQYSSKDCPGGTTVILNDGEKVPANATPCRLCGHPHALFIVETIVGVGEG